MPILSAFALISCIRLIFYSPCLPDRLLRELQNAVRGQFLDQVRHVLHGLFRGYVEGGAHMLFDDLLKGGAAVGRFPDCRGDLIEVKKSGVARRQDHGFPSERSRRDIGASSDVGIFHWINSHTRASGKKVSRKTGTRVTSSHADSKTRPTSSGS